MIRLYIDNQEADIDPRSDISVSLSVASLTSTSWGRAGYSKSITIPATPRNQRLMGDCQQTLAAEKFNHSLHTGRVEVDGCVIIEGTIYLSAAAIGPEGFYRFNIIGNAREWVASAQQSIRELPVEWSATLSEEAIAESLKAEQGLVRFLPVERGVGEGKKGFYNRTLSVAYHPFVHIGSLVEAIFAKAGYAVESEFMASDFFRSLFMSGRWSERNFGEWGEDMDFLAVRKEDSEVATANSFGRVYANLLANYNTIGNLVDVPDGEGGSYGTESFGVDNTGRICYTPPRPVMASFEYHLIYETDYRIESRERLSGLGYIRPYYGDGVKVPIKNTFADRRGGPLAKDKLYTFIVFDHTEGALYNLYAKVVTNPSADVNNLRPEDYQERLLLTSTERSATLLHSLDEMVVEPRVELVLDGLSYSVASDWALYDGYIGEYGKKRVDVTLRSRPEYCSPEEPFFFDLFYFGGGEEGYELKVLAGTSIRPILHPHPAMGDELGWEDVMNYSFTGLDLIAALKELFDLQIYTDPLDRKVCIEPRRNWCDPQVVIDLSERIDLSRGVVVEELGSGHPKLLSLRYRAGDRASEELAEVEGCEYGVWSAEVRNIFAEEGERRVQNRLFTAAVDEVGRVHSAPSASLVRVGDSEVGIPNYIGYLNFLPKIVSFRGLKTLPSWESWEYPYGISEEYPLVTFFDDGSQGGSPRSLLFEDRGGVAGLHTYWDPRVEALNHSRRLTLYITLYPDEVEQIVVPNSTKHDFRAHYLLTIDGEKVLCRLEEIVDYNPNSPSTKVIFETIS